MCQSFKTFFLATALISSAITAFAADPVVKATGEGNIVSSGKPSGSLEVISDKTYNFGTVRQGDIVKHGIVYRNVGKDTLFIENVKGS